MLKCYKLCCHILHTRDISQTESFSKSSNLTHFSSYLFKLWIPNLVAIQGNKDNAYDTDDTEYLFIEYLPYAKKNAEYFQ